MLPRASRDESHPIHMQEKKSLSAYASTARSTRSRGSARNEWQGQAHKHEPPTHQRQIKPREPSPCATSFAATLCASQSTRHQFLSHPSHIITISQRCNSIPCQRTHGERAPKWMQPEASSRSSGASTLKPGRKKNGCMILKIMQLILLTVIREGVK